MSTCLSPLKGFAVGVNPSGRPDYKVCSADTDFVYELDGRWYPGHDLGERSNHIVRESIMIPCGQCIECRLNYSRNWANRMMLEAQYHEFSYFLTLTYDDFHVPLSYFPDPDTGEALPAMTLVKRDMQAFMKRLRRRLEYVGRPQIRFYGCGEYGTFTKRPHYHIIVFGLVLDDLERLKTSKLGFPYFRSKLIEECWPNGYSMVCNVSWETCAYVARYVTKKFTGDYKDFYETFNLTPEFSLMSRKPGIGRQYYEDHKDEMYQTDEMFVSTATGGKTVKPAPYYDKLYDLEQPDLLAKVKMVRRDRAEHAEELRQQQTTLSMDEQQEARYKLLLRRYEMLKREDV